MRDTVREAFAATPRTWFLPADVRASAAIDAPLPIGHGQTNSQPSTVAAMLDLLEVPAGARVLDVGSGSGWSTALLAHLVGESGRVIGVERIPELTAFGAGNLARTGRPWAEIRQATQGVLGVPDEAPYDRILVSAGAGRMPHPLTDQLRDGGIMVIPVRQTMFKAVRRGDDVTVTSHGAYSFVPLK